MGEDEVIKAFSRILIVALPTVLGSVQATAQPADPIAGTWELNVAKSKFTGEAPKSETRTYQVLGNRIIYSGRGVRADGRTVQVHYAAKLDGRDYPVTGSPISDHVSIRRIDAHTHEVLQKRDGKVVVSGKHVVSKDGKLLTVFNEGVDAQGRPRSTFQVFDRVER